MYWHMYSSSKRTVIVELVRILGIPHDLVVEDVAHGHPGVVGVGLLNGVHG